MNRLALALSISSLALSSCGGGSTTTDTGGAIDAPPGATDAPGIDVLLPDSGPACGYVDTLDRGCTTDADCTVGVHQTDCCGSTVYIGYAATALSAYQTGEMACEASYPGCLCPPMFPVTDSGEMTADTSMVRAACVSRGPRNVCLTYVTMRPADGR